VDSDRTAKDWASELWPDDRPDPDWPEVWPESGRPGRAHRPQGSGVPPEAVGSGPRRRSRLALGLTVVVALGAGAGAVYLYKGETAGFPTAATSSPGTAIGGTTVTSLTMLGRVLAIRHDSITVGGGPGQAISARATTATRFAGTVRSLVQVRVGDTVMAQITVSGGVATLVRLQDPASES